MHKSDVSRIHSSSGTLAEVGTTTSATLTPTVGTANTVSDCVITLAPTLTPGKLYTLTLPAKAVTDSATLLNPYDGIHFTFYTPVATPFIDTGNARNLGTDDPRAATTSSILLSFYSGTPRLGLTDSTQTITVNDTSTASASNATGSWWGRRARPIPTHTSTAKSQRTPSTS